MTSPGNDASPLGSPRIDRRRAAILLLLAGLVLGGVFLWRRPTVPTTPPPIVDLDESHSDVRTAVDDARKAVLADATSAGAWGEYGMCLYAHGFALQALECFVQSEQLDPEDHRWPYLSGIAVTFTDPERGRDCFVRASRLRPDLAFVRLRTAELLIDLSETEQARMHVDDVLSREPDNPRALLCAARLAQVRGDLEESRDLALRCRERAPDAVAALDLLATVCFQLGDEEAAREYQLLLRESGRTITEWPDPLLTYVMSRRRDEHWVLFRIQEQLDQGQIAEALAGLERAVAEYPDSIELRMELVRTYSALERSADAADVLGAGLRRAPDSARLHRTAGVLHTLNGEHEQAAREFRQAVELKPDYALARFELGECLLQLGDEAGALRQLEAAAMLRSDVPGLNARIEELKARLR